MHDRAVMPLQALAKDPAARPTVVQLQRHPFLAPYTTPEMLRWSAAVDVPVSWALQSCVGLLRPVQGKRGSPVAEPQNLSQVRCCRPV